MTQTHPQYARPLEILLVEDLLSDIELITDLLGQMDVLHDIHVVRDGVDAIAFLKQQGRYVEKPRPDLVLLDLNLPRKNGHEVLAEAKADPSLRQIPIIVLTTSSAALDVQQAYDRYANCYMLKSSDLTQFNIAFQAFEDYWFKTVQLPLERE